MSTTVRIGREYKKKLDRLQARLFIKTGKRISLQRLLELAVSLSIESEEELIGSISNDLQLSEDEVKEILASPRDWGVVTSEEEIDRELYGERTH